MSVLPEHLHAPPLCRATVDIPAPGAVTPHTSHLTQHTSHVTRHTSHLTHHTSHLTPHTSHLTPYTTVTPPSDYLRPPAVPAHISRESQSPRNHLAPSRHAARCVCTLTIRPGLPLHFECVRKGKLRHCTAFFGFNILAGTGAFQRTSRLVACSRANVWRLVVVVSVRSPACSFCEKV